MKLLQAAVLGDMLQAVVALLVAAVQADFYEEMLL
jgi:hypothetical protein